MKSYGCLLTHWLPMRSILFRIVRICCSRFKCNNLKNENFLAIIFSISEIFIKFYKFWKKGDRHSEWFPKLQIVKDLVRPLSKKLFFRTFFDCQHVKGSQTNTCEICMTALLSYIFITLNGTNLEKISLINMSSLRGFCASLYFF